MSLFNELKRRNVIRVCMMYLAGAWLVLQVADTISPWLGLSDAAGRILLVVLAVGIVPVVVVSWLFEWTPDGIRFDDEVEVDAAGTVVARRRLDRIVIAMLSLAVVYFAVDKFLFNETRIDADGGDKSVAVLPFEDISPGGDQAYLAKGISSEVRRVLQGLDGLRVSGTVSSVAFAQESSMAIGEALNVDKILSGSVRKDGSRVRVTVELIDAAEGYVEWVSDPPYDRALEGIFELQEEIASSVAGYLGVSLGVGGVNAFVGAGTTNVEAYEAYLKAVDMGYSRSAIPLLERATTLDPNYGPAYSSMAITLLNRSWSATPDQMSSFQDRVYELASKGAELSPDSAVSLSILGVIRMWQYDWVGAEQAHRRATDLLEDRLTLARYAVALSRAGRLDDATEKFKLAETVEPMGGRPVAQYWHTILARGLVDEAREYRNRRPGNDLFLDNLDLAFNEVDPAVLKAAIQELPEALPAYINLYGPVLAEFDSPDRVLTILKDRYHNDELQWSRKLHDIAMTAAYFGHSEFALQVKKTDILVNPARVVAIWYPVFSKVRRLPAFKDLMRELNFVEYWRADGWPNACGPMDEEDFECA